MTPEQMGPHAEAADRGASIRPRPVSLYGGASRVFGSPAAALAESGLRADLVHQGRLGEERLSSVALSVLDDVPDLLVFHSVRLPGTRGDIDQLLYSGGHFYLVDAKLWKGFNGSRRVTYDVAMRDSETMVFARDGQPFTGGSVKAPRQVEEWRRYLGTRDVWGVVVLMDPGARVGDAATNQDVLVLAGLEYREWLRSLRARPPLPLHYEWIHGLAGLTVGAGGGHAGNRHVRSEYRGSRAPAPLAPPVPVRPMHPRETHAPPPAAAMDGRGVSALAIASVAWLLMPFGYPLAVLAVILASASVGRARRLKRRARLAAIGLAIGIAHLVVFAPAVVVSVFGPLMGLF